MKKKVPTPGVETGRHLPSLDGVRGAAIFLVVFYHLTLFNDNNGRGWMEVVSQIRNLGWMGVDLFFVLSGFLITGILYDNVHQQNFFRNFYMRRFLRIFPLYYGFLLALLILTPVLHVAWRGHQYVLLAYLQDTAIWFPNVDYQLANLVDLRHFWSLAVEEKFYLFWPPLVFLIKDRRRLMLAALVFSVCALALRIALRLQGPPVPLAPMLACTPCRMDSLLIGAYLALMMRGEKPQLAKWYCEAFFIAIMAMMLGIALKYPGGLLMQNFFVGTLGYSLIAIAFASLIFLAIQSSTIWNRFFSIKWLRSLGKYSYGIYVLHILVGRLVSGTWQRLLGTSLRIWLLPHVNSRALAVAMEFAVTFSIIYCVAWISFNLYEVHFLRMKRYFPSRSNVAAS